MSFSEEQIRINERLDFIERQLMTPIIKRSDIKILMYLASALTIIGVIMLLGEFYLMSQINHVYSLLE